MQGVLIDDHRIHVDFSQSVCSFHAHPVSTTDRTNRYHAFQTNGVLLQIPNEPNMEAVLVALRVWRRRDTSGLWIQKQTRTVNALMATDILLTRTQYAMTETRNLIGETGRGNTHEVGVPEATIGTESVSPREMFGEEETEETEVGTMDEMIMRTAAGGGSGMSDDKMEQTDIIRVMMPCCTCTTGVGAEILRHWETLNCVYITITWSNFLHRTTCEFSTAPSLHQVCCDSSPGCIWLRGRALRLGMRAVVNNPHHSAIPLFRSNSVLKRPYSLSITAPFD